MLHRWILLIALAGLGPAAVFACGDDTSKARPDGGPPTPTTTATTPPTGTPIDAGPDARRSGCLDRPTQLARPDGRLPCELIPPGLTL